MNQLPYVVMVRCPTVDTAVSTGVRCDVAHFADLAANNQLSCPACGKQHEWSVADAWLRDAAFASGQLDLTNVHGADAKR